jgi:hypothetical protein
LKGQRTETEFDPREYLGPGIKIRTSDGTKPFSLLIIFLSEQNKTKAFAF